MLAHRADDLVYGLPDFSSSQSAMARRTQAVRAPILVPRADQIGPRSRALPAS